MINSSDSKDSSVKNARVFLTLENRLQMVVYERELKVYAKTNAITKVIAVMADDEKPYWVLEFQFKGEEERAVLVTSLNKPRQFKRLNYMVSLIQEWCPKLDNIILELHPR